MVKLEYFKIDLQNQTGIFRPGETVAGVVSYKVTKRGKINQVRLDAVGDGYVHWSEQHGSGKNSHTVHYSGYEVFYKFQQVYVAKTGKEDLFMEEGEQSHSFQFVLPQVLPSSVEHHCGRHRYTIVGTFDIPWSFDKYCNRTISVISTVDLNLIPAIREPCTVSQSKTVCCWCCESEPIEMTLSIRKGGFVAGETLVCDVSIKNPTSRTVKPPTVLIGQNIILNATSKTRVLHRTAASVTLPNPVGKKSSEEYNNVQLVVPPTCPSTLNMSRVLQISYFVSLNISISGPSTGGVASIPIVIGTIPIGGSQQQSNNWSFQPSVFGGIENPGFGTNLPKGEAVSNDLSTFKPQYPFFQDFSLNAR